MIAADVLDRFARLKQITTLAVAASDGLRPLVEHARQEAQKFEGHFAAVARDYGGRVTAENGAAFLHITNRVERKDERGPVVTWEQQRSRLPELDPHAADLCRARDRLAEVRDQQRALGQRSAGLQRALAEARAALHDRHPDWREDRP